MKKRILILVLVLSPGISWACATCYGAADAPATQGMNWAIITLLGITGSMLGSIVTVLVRFKNRAKKFSIQDKEL